MLACVPTMRDEEVDRAVVEFERAIDVVLAKNGLADALTRSLVFAGLGDCCKVDPGAVFVWGSHDRNSGRPFGGIDITCGECHRYGQVGDVDDADEEVLVVPVVGHPDSAIGS